MKNAHPLRVLFLVAALMFATAALPEAAAIGETVTENMLYRFCSQSACADGAHPYSDLIMDGAGNLYGTTLYGGSSSCGYGCGTVFKLAPTSAGWTQTVLYSFCSQAACADGGYPQAGLIMDGAGNLYGTTFYGGTNCPSNFGCGTVFKLAPNSTGWTESVLYSFCSQSNCADGATPLAGLIMDSAGNLYGTTFYGGGNCVGTDGCGTVFKLAPTSFGWAESVLYSFCSQSSCVDGRHPEAAVIMDSAGNLYGTTIQGGANCTTGLYNSGCGTVFKLALTSTGWTESVLYSFCSQTVCVDGATPLAGLIMDSAGSLYGTTQGGGENRFYYGTVFKLAPTANGWTETVLYRFCSQGGDRCADGEAPQAGLIMDGAGNLYGTTTGGGPQSKGTVFILTPIAGNWIESVLHSFCSQSGCADGDGPRAGLTMDGAGNLYGSTVFGGNFCVNITNYDYCGGVFQLTPGISLSVSVVGNPGGRVTSSPAGIDCGATCSASFAAGIPVTLIATPDITWGFAGWGGACGGIGGCTVTMNASTSVSASFTTLFSAPVVAQPDPGLPPPILSPLPQPPPAY
jgi:uncharacterized repeat protein (TIGR03803 family)